MMPNSNFFVKPLANGGQMSGFHDTPGIHATTPTPGCSFQPHVTLDHGPCRDFSRSVQSSLNGFSQMGGLEQRVSTMDAFRNSGFGGNMRGPGGPLV